MSDELIKSEKDVVTTFCIACLHETTVSKKEISTANIRVIPIKNAYAFGLRIVSIAAKSVGWSIVGEGDLDPQSRQVAVVEGDVRCSHCGAIYHYILHAVPIECAPFPCPNCGESRNLQYKILKIQAEEDRFQFEAEITCKKCDSKKSFQAIIKKIFEVIKINIGPTGITVSNS